MVSYETATNIKNLLHENFGDKYDFLQLYSVVLNVKNCVCGITFLFPCTMESVGAEARAELTTFFKTYLELKADVHVKFKKSFLDSMLVKKEIKAYFVSQQKGLAPYLSLDQVFSENEGLNVKVLIKMNSDVLAMVDTGDITREILAWLQTRFIASFEISFEGNEEILPDEIDFEDFDEPVARVPRYDVKIMGKITSGDFPPKPEFIRNITTAKTGVILAGKVTEFKRKTFVAKRGKLKGQEKAFYTFNLEDDTGKIECVYFSTKAASAKLDKITQLEGIMLLCEGEVKPGLSDSLTFYIKNMAIACECEQQPQQERKMMYGGKVFPEPLEQKFQENFFHDRPKYKEIITENDIVIFDIETTGLDVNTSEITEIGAVKIFKGQIKQKFSSFVRIKGTIPDEVVELTHITNEMVAYAPRVEDVIADFYKFCEGCIIGGHNVLDFDLKFIQREGAKIGLNFDHETIDTLLVARRSPVKTNVFTLAALTKVLNIPLEGAHRAYNDAEATAKVLLELSKVRPRKPIDWQKYAQM